MRYFENLRHSVIYQEWTLRIKNKMEFVNFHHVVGFPVHHHKCVECVFNNNNNDDDDDDDYDLLLLSL